MTISGLKSILTADFLQKAASPTDTKESSADIAKELTSGASKTNLATTLRTGARNFSLGLQALNAGISYVQVSKSTQEKLLGIAEDVSDLVDRAASGSESSATALASFRKLSRSFDHLVAQSKVKGASILDADEITSKLKSVGLDPATTDGLTQALHPLKSLDKTTVTTDQAGQSTVTTASLPADDLLKDALTQARGALEENAAGEVTDQAAFFSNIKKQLAAVTDTLHSNVKALDTSLKVIADNINLVRATGLAFLNASDQIKGTEEAEAVALDISQQVRRASKGGSIPAQNLPNILKAGQVLLAQTVKN